MKANSGLVRISEVIMLGFEGPLWAETGHWQPLSLRQLCQQLCRSEDFSERPLPFNADLQVKFLGMTTNSDRYPLLTLAKVSRFSDAAQERETELLEKDSKAN